MSEVMVVEAATIKIQSSIKQGRVAMREVQVS